MTQVSPEVSDGSAPTPRTRGRPPRAIEPDADGVLVAELERGLGRTKVKR